MPQLDKFSFATQLFWFCTFFVSYYLLIINKFLPNLFKILRFRTAKLKIFSIGINKYLSEELLVIFSYVNLIVKNMAINIQLSNKILTKYLIWLKKNKEFLLY